MMYKSNCHKNTNISLFLQKFTKNSIPFYVKSPRFFFNYLSNNKIQEVNGRQLLVCFTKFKPILNILINMLLVFHYQ